MSPPLMREAAVVGVPHETYGERPVVFVATSDQMDGQVLRDHLSGHPARRQVPDRVVVVDAIPKTNVEKPDTKLLRSPYV